jgi:geranylgeranyl transferase type-2 subunit alpha
LLEKKDEKIKNEFELCKNAFYTIPNEQSAWIYHLWLIENNKEIHKEDIETCFDILDIEPNCKCNFFIIISKKGR